MLFANVFQKFTDGLDIRRSSWPPNKFWRLVRNEKDFAQLASEHDLVANWRSSWFDYPVVFEVDPEGCVTTSMVELLLDELLADDWTDAQTSCASA